MEHCMTKEDENNDDSYDEYAEFILDSCKDKTKRSDIYFRIKQNL